MPWLLRFPETRALPSVERVEGLRYERVLSPTSRLRVRLHDGTVEGEIDTTDSTTRSATVQRTWLDLDVPLAEVTTQLWRDPRLRPIMSRAPIGMRLPRLLDPFEALVRAMIGQLISVAAARTITQRLVERIGPFFLGSSSDGDRPSRAFPSADALATFDPDDLRALGLTRAKSTAIIGAARALVDGRIA